MPLALALACSGLAHLLWQGDVIGGSRGRGKKSCVVWGGGVKRKPGWNVACLASRLVLRMLCEH